MRHPHSLQGIRILSLALNLPGPAALQRCHAMGAICTKIEPPTADGTGSGDPMALYSPQAYHALHQGIRVLQVHLKTPEGQHQLQQELQTSDVLLTSFRPAALHKLGLDWPALHTRYPRLCMVRILGDARPEAADLPGHDLTYQAEAGLVRSGHMPTSLHADMAGALSASEALLHTLLERARNGLGNLRDVGLAQAAQWLAQPLGWGLTTPQGDVGGAHAGYRVYATADGHVAIAALEPHFAQRLCAAAGIDCDGQAIHMRSPGLHTQLEAFLQQTSGADLARIAAERDIPLHVLPGHHPMGMLQT
ncbi:MAG: CoA transferase [Acidovorax sp.]|nr:CoA transferase [Acidovorax sp.]